MRQLLPALLLGFVFSDKIDALLDSAKCMTTPAIESLSALPKGRFAGSIDFGSTAGSAALVAKIMAAES